ncbi:MAG: Rrf2 family transcriptional regulator, partial [Candidatus Omnitrophota bacterium]
FLRKILQILNKDGFLKSYKGKGGGFKMGLSPKNISIVDVIETFQGPLKLNECRLHKLICPNIRTCRLKKKLDAIELYVSVKLRGITIESLVREGARKNGKKEDHKNRGR